MSDYFPGQKRRLELLNKIELSDEERSELVKLSDDLAKWQLDKRTRNFDVPLTATLAEIVMRKLK